MVVTTAICDGFVLFQRNSGLSVKFANIIVEVRCDLYIKAVIKPQTHVCQQSYHHIPTLLCSLFLVVLITVILAVIRDRLKTCYLI